jgi:ubiquinone/menaquinone biosynthesis C-methylase UbiE
MRRAGEPLRALPLALRLLPGPPVRDDTEKIAASLWPAGGPSEGDSLLELGCRPGFYARRLAARFEHLQVTGIDRSERQLRRAPAATQCLRNCTFEEEDALALDRPISSVDAVVVSRLFIVLAEGDRVIEGMHRVLKPGGCCFVAEPPCRSKPFDCVPGCQNSMVDQEATGNRVRSR